MKLVVYTAIAADYDALRSPAYVPAGVDFVCFTEPGKPVPAGWTQRDLPRRDLPPQSQNRYAKFHAHELFPEHDASIYIDGNIEVVGDVAALADRALGAADIAFYDHPVRISAFEEAIECALVGYASAASIRHQIRRYHAEGFAFQGGLFEGNIIVRAHRESRVAEAMRLWWAEWQRGVKRDQMSLMYVLWHAQLRVTRLGRHDGRFIHEFFHYHPHRRPLGRSVGRIAQQVWNRIDLAIFGMRVHRA